MNSNTSTTAIGQATVYSVLMAVACSHLLNDMIQSVVPALYPMIKDDFALTFAQIGTLTLVFQLTSSLLQPLMGHLADKHPAPYSLALGMCFTFIGIACLSIAHSFGFLLLSLSLIGCGSSVFHPLASRIAQVAAGRRKGVAQSIFQVGGNAGSAFGPLLAAFLVLPYGQPAVAWMCIAAFLAIVVLVRIGSWYGKRIQTKGGIAVDATVAHPFSRRKVLWLLGVLMLLLFSKYFYLACMTNYFTFFLIDKFGVSVLQSQYCLFAFLAASAIGTVAGGFVGDKYGRKRVIWGSILGAAPFALALPYVGLAAAVCLAVMVGLILSSAFSAILVYATELVPGRTGIIAGLFYGFMFGLGGLGSAFFGWLADLTSIEFIFKISALLPLLGIVAAFLPNLKNDR